MTSKDLFLLNALALLTTQELCPIRTKKLYSRLFMHGDYLLDVPADLSLAWSVVLRPEGERCLAVLVGNLLTLRSRNGNIIDSTFICDSYVKNPWVMDAVLGIDETRMRPTLFVFDVLLGEDFATRRIWLQTHWPFGQEGMVQGPQVDSGDECPAFVLLPAVPATSINIRAAYYTGDDRFSSDSLLLFRNSAKYKPGLTQDALMFRDDHLSRFAIDTPDESAPSEMRVVLRLSRQSPFTLSTWDGSVVHNFIDELPPQCKPNGMVGAIVGPEGLHSFSPSKKPFPNSMNRILDQLRKRRTNSPCEQLGFLPSTDVPVAIQQLLE